MLKKPGLKLLSILLSLGMVTSYHHCFAMHKKTTTSSGKSTKIKKFVSINDTYIIKNDKLKKQVEIFVKRAPDVFQVEEELIKQTDPELLEPSLRKLNSLFDKYKVFVDALIKKLRGRNEKFTLGCFTKSNSNDTVARSNINQIKLNPTYYSKNDIKDYIEGYHSPVDTNQRKVSTTTHEFGHVIEAIIYTPMAENLTNEINKAYEQIKEIMLKTFTTLKTAKQNPIGIESLREAERLADEMEEIEKRIIKNKEVRDAIAADPAGFIKAEIIKIAQSKYEYFNTEISRYGETNPHEWFAEVFAHLECSSKPNELGLAMKNYLEQQANLINQENNN